MPTLVSVQHHSAKCGGKKKKPSGPSNMSAGFACFMCSRTFSSKRGLSLHTRRTQQELREACVPMGDPNPVTVSSRDVNSHLKKVIFKLAISVYRNGRLTKVRSVKSYFNARCNYKSHYRIIYSLWRRNRRGAEVETGKVQTAYKSIWERVGSFVSLE